MMVLGNKAEKAKAVDDDDDGDSEDKKLLLSITASFREQSEIVQHLFDFISEVFSIDAETPLVIVNYPGLSSMLERGMILTENQFLRKSVGERIKDILKEVHTKTPRAANTEPSINEVCFVKIFETMLTSLVTLSKESKYEGRSSHFYVNLTQVLELLEPKDLHALNSQILGLINQLPKDIMERTTKEIGSSDTDILLGGLINVLTRLLQRFPVFKQQVGATLTHYIVHDCLFEIPHGNKNAPKCKSA
jgi:hypothetical protein